jgi:hypothetical protein
MGLREQMELEQLSREAKDVPDEVLFTVTGFPIPPEVESTYGADFKSHDLSGMTLGSLVMRDHDGAWGGGESGRGGAS